MAPAGWTAGSTPALRIGLGHQWHINIPNALAKAINPQKGEEIEWEVESRTLLVLVRKTAPLGRRLKIQEPS